MNVIKTNFTYEITIAFEKGEKCLCCDDIFNEDTLVVKKFKNKKEYDEFIFLMLDLRTQLITNK